jgi:hypothetical protein
MSVVTSGNERLFPGQPLIILEKARGPDLGLDMQPDTARDERGN